MTAAYNWETEERPNLELALRTAKQGRPVIPAHPSCGKLCRSAACQKKQKCDRAKKPRTDHGFLDATTDEAQIRAWWAKWPSSIVAMPTGSATGIAVLDIDYEVDPATGEVRKDAMTVLGPLMERHGWQFPDTVEVSTPRGGRHLWFHHEDGFKTTQGATYLDTRAEGGYIIVPGSTMADGRRYEYQQPEGLFPIAKAPPFVAEIFRHGFKSLMEPNPAPQAEDRPNATDAGGVSEECHPADVETILNRHWNPDSYEDWYKAAFACHVLRDGFAIWTKWAARSDKFDEAENRKKWAQCEPRSGNPFGPRSILARASKEELSELAKARLPGSPKIRMFDGGGAAEAPKEPDGTPEPPVDAPATAPVHLWDPWREPAAPAFPLDVLPEDVAQYVQERGTETGACRSAIAMSCLAVASGALTHEARLYLKPGQNFGVSPRLWVLLVGDPSAKKSPAMDGAMKPLISHQRAVQGAQLAAWRAEQEAEEGKGKKKSSAPELTHFLVHDTTPERLAEVLSHQDRGVLIGADELAGWLGALDRYASGKGASSSRAIWLQAYNGGPFTLLRVTRHTLPVNNLSASILGGIQPERLREIGGLTSDGLLQRFLPVMMAKPQIDRDGFSTAAFRAWDERVRSLLGYSRFATELAPEAREERKRVAQVLFDLGRGDSEGAGWQGFVGKLPGVWGNLALLLHILWGYRAADPVALETAQRASKLLEEFVLPHGLAFYRSLVGTGQADARAIAGFLAGWEQRTISVRDFVRGPRCCRALSPEEIASKLAPFEAGGWLEPEKPGPWNRKWALTPGLGARFGEELARHRATIAAIQTKITGGSDDED